MSNRSCKLFPNSFYVCGCYVGPKQVKNTIVRGTKYYRAYEAYFGMPMGDQDKMWAPHIICGSCRSTLEGWLRGSRRCMQFGIPRIWREPTNHMDDCYFCMVDIAKYKKPADKNSIVYPNIPSSIAPVPHGADLPIPTAPVTERAEESEEEHQALDDDDWELEDASTSRLPHFPTQQELDDLVRDLGLSKGGAELLASRLKEWNLLDPSCKVSTYRRRHVAYSKFFTVAESLCYCTDVCALFNEIGIEHDHKEWRLFIDSSSRSLKAVLLHNGNVLPSIPVAHSVHLKEDYLNIKTLLQKIQYKWNVCGDLKMIGFLMELQGGYTKHPCFLCLWDSRDDDQHYHRRDWPVRHNMQPGAYNIKFNCLVDVEKILLPPLHIKLGLIKQFVKALDQTGETYQKIRSFFPKLSDAKVTGGIFVGPQVKHMMASQDLEATMTDAERRAWSAFRNVIDGFLGNNRVVNYRELVEELLDSYRNLGCRMSIKLHYLHSHLDFFPPNLGAVSDEHGERFHQDIQAMERRYQGRWDEAMMGDYVWGLVRDDTSCHKRQKRSKVHF